MEKRRCGNSDLELSVLGVGCMSFGGGAYFGPQTQQDVGEVVNTALDHGITYFDTAESYDAGRSEEALGLALKGCRERATIGTKVSPEFTQPDVLRQHCEMSLRRLQTDWIDLYMIHWPIAKEAMEGAFSTLEALKKEGKIRSIGVSNFGIQQLSEAQAAGAKMAANQLIYNLLARAIETDILPACRQAGIGVIGYMPLMQGLLTGRYSRAEEMRSPMTRTRHFNSNRPASRHGEAGAEAETFAAVKAIKDLAEGQGLPMIPLVLAWVMSRPGVTCVLAGSRNVQQLLANIEGASLKVFKDVLDHLDELTEPLYKKLGSNADYWESTQNRRVR